MRWQDRLAVELTKPRESPVLQYAVLAWAGLTVLWGTAVCIVLTAAVIAAFIDLFTA